MTDELKPTAGNLANLLGFARKGPTPNKYVPHEGKRQCARQARQLAAGIIRLQHHVVPVVVAPEWSVGR